MAGTPIDTNMGAVLLEKNGFSEGEIIRIPISENPVKQTIFQTSETEYKEKVINGHINNIKKADCNVLFVYCNSLSGAVDFEKLEKKNNIKIVTPMQIYKEIAGKYKKIAVFAANAQGLAGIENAMFKGNSEINITGMTSLLVSILLSRCFIILKSVLTIPIGFNLLKKAFSFFASSLVRKGESIW